MDFQSSCYQKIVEYSTRHIQNDCSFFMTRATQFFPSNYVKECSLLTRKREKNVFLGALRWQKSAYMDVLWLVLAVAATLDKWSSNHTHCHQSTQHVLNSDATRKIEKKSRNVNKLHEKNDKEYDTKWTHTNSTEHVNGIEQK